MSKFLLLNCCLFIVNLHLAAQSYDYWAVGDTADVSPDDFLRGLVLAGGGSDNDDAMQWMLERAGGGDVLVIRASNSDGYNDYFYEDLGIDVHSVETIRFNTPDAASDPYVIQKIRNAEVLFVAGGDQYDYYQLWKDNAMEEAINYLINEKGITIGGTSAGMAILGKAYYTPPGSSATSAAALANPFASSMNIIGKDDFINHPLMDNVITDTHYDQRDRHGRHLAFLARIAIDHGVRSFGIACNEYTAVCVDETGTAKVFGAHPDYDDYAYFLQSNCTDEFQPEICMPGMPLTWDKTGQAVTVYRVPGTPGGQNTFDLNTWQNGTGGSWYKWSALEGEMTETWTSNSDCNIVVSLEEPKQEQVIGLAPNPVEGILKIRVLNHRGASTLEITDSTGRHTHFLELDSGKTEFNIDVSALKAGWYHLKIKIGGKNYSASFTKN